MFKFGVELDVSWKSQILQNAFVAKKFYVQRPWSEVPVQAHRNPASACFKGLSRDLCRELRDTNRGTKLSTDFAIQNSGTILSHDSGRQLPDKIVGQLIPAGTILSRDSGLQLRDKPSQKVHPGDPTTKNNAKMAKTGGTILSRDLCRELSADRAVPPILN